MEVELDGVHYAWNGRGWVDRDGIVPPVALRLRLNQLNAHQIATADAHITDPSELTKLAQIAATNGEQSRAIDLARRAFKADPSNEGRAATLVSVLRKVHRPDSAAGLLRVFPHTAFAPLLTAFAALLCDLERWDEALAMAKRAWAAGGRGETSAVFSRIKQQRPDLVK